MVVEGPIAAVGRRVISTIRDYADRRFGSDHYRILVRLDPDWGKVHVIFAIPSLEARGGEDRVWTDLKNYLLMRFRDEPEMAQSCLIRVEDDREGNPFLYYAVNHFSDSVDLFAHDPVV